jgi:CPA2 family monovalent cation:H+ antiporter-2
MEPSAPVVLDIALVLLAAAAAGWAARQIGLPAVVGYLAAGLFVSPFTPGFVADREEILLLADIGVVLLLFEVGIEIDLVRIRREQRQLFWIAPAQIVLTSLVTAGVLLAMGRPAYGAALLGVAVAMSSSVVVVNITRSRRRTTDRSTEHALLGWTVLQDVTGVALAAVVLATFGSADRPAIVSLSLLGVFVALAVGAAWLLPRVLRHIRHEHDLFLIVSVAGGLALAGIGAVVFGVPMALAAFVAGLAISEGGDTGEARRRLLPFRDVFAVLFFVALGSLIDPGGLPDSAPFLGILIGLVIVAKSGLIWVLARLVRLEARPGQLAVGLGQVGEFAFVLGSVGLTAGVVSDAEFSALLTAVVVTIAASTILVRLGPWPRAVHAPADDAGDEAAAAAADDIPVRGTDGGEPAPEAREPA